MTPDYRKLRDHAALNETLELSWLGEEAADEIRARWLHTWQQSSFDEPFHTDCRDRLLRCVPLATGASRERRLSYTASELVLVHDPHFPEQVFISLGRAFPSKLWADSPSDPATLLEVVSRYLAASVSVLELRKTVRVVKFPGVDLATIEHALDAEELWLDDANWGSAHDDDPWMGVEGPLNMIQQTVWSEDTAKQHGGRRLALSWRTLWSKSVLRVEQQAFGCLFEMRYMPGPESSAVALVNELTSGHLPLDMPVDLAASLLRGANLDGIHIADLRARSEHLGDQLLLQAALEPGEPSTVAALRDVALKHPDDEEILGRIADLAAFYRYDGLLFELAIIADGSELGANLLAHLSPPSPTAEEVEQ